MSKPLDLKSKKECNETMSHRVSEMDCCATDCCAWFIAEIAKLIWERNLLLDILADIKIALTKLEGKGKQ